jgi:threonine dehydrogenase-like Zn-dependent dehydrogenase
VRALSLNGPRDVAILEVPTPRPAPDEVLLRVSACGVCGSDLNAWRGVPGLDYPLPPGAPGHEVSGEVLEVGRDVTTLRAGQQVTGPLWNGFAEMAVARAADLLPIPPEVGDILGEPLACAMNVVRRARLQPADEIAFVGFGYLAALIVHLLPSACTWIAIVGRHDSRVLAQRLGAVAAYDFDEVPSDAWDHFPVVIEVAGAQRALDHATWLSAYGGRLVVAGYHADGPRSVNMQSWNWKGIDVINAHERQTPVYVAALREAFELLRSRRRNVSDLHTHHWSLEQAADAFRAAEDRPAGFVKSVVHP